MRISAFEQAAAEATFGMQEIDGQMEQIKAQLEQLKGKRELLRSLSHQLNILRGDTTQATASDAAKPAEAPKAEEPAYAGAPAEASSSARSLREGWSGRGPETGDRPSLDSIIRGRL